MEIKLTSSGDLEGLTAEVDKSLRAANRRVGREIAKVARKAILDDVRGSRPGGLRFGTKRGGGGRYRLGAKSTIVPSALGVDVTITATPAGFWSMVEYGTRAHEIVPRTGRALFFDGRFAAHVSHPGTSGHPYWAGAET